ncbi:MAG: hypothetical protein MZU97_13695 [Bacillus subtilis]|nr:hypothetical protein [Bacillus subtilis]
MTLTDRLNSKGQLEQAGRRQVHHRPGRRRAVGRQSDQLHQHRQGQGDHPQDSGSRRGDPRRLLFRRIRPPISSTTSKRSINLITREKRTTDFRDIGEVAEELLSRRSPHRRKSSATSAASTPATARSTTTPWACSRPNSSIIAARPSGR